MGAGRQPGRRAVFLDRDGVINQNIYNPVTGQYEAPLTADYFALIPGVPESLQRLQAAGFLLFLVSNQPNYAKRKASLADIHSIHAQLQRELAAMHVEFAAAYYCLHHPEGYVTGYSRPCACRKPSPYFLIQASREFGLDLARSWMVGDRETDIQCGQAAGAATILIGTNASECVHAAPDRVVPNLAAAAECICAVAESANWPR